MEKNPEHLDHPSDKTDLLLEEGENPATFHRCLEMLRQKGVDFKHFSHKPVRTSEDAAKVRGFSLASGAKAMLCKYTASGEEKFCLLVMSASRKIAWKEVKQYLGSKNATFAKVEEVNALTGCIPGAVPPFGSVFGVQTIVDPSLEAQGDVINFNVGLRSQTLTLATKDYLKVENPKILSFTSE